MSQVVSTQNPAASSNANEEAHVSGPNQEHDILGMVLHAMKLKIKTLPGGDSTTRERFTINREKVINAVRVEWKSRDSKEKRDRVPDEIDKIIINTVEAQIAIVLKRVNPLNGMSVVSKVVPDFKNDQMVLKHTATGKDMLRLQEQHLFNGIAIREANERLTRLQSKMTPDLEGEKKCKEYISKLQKMALWIETNIAAIEKATS